MNVRLFDHAGHPGARWFRICGYGVQFKHLNNPPLFSERNGFERFHKLGFGWRFRFIGPAKYPTAKV